MAGRQLQRLLKQQLPVEEPQEEDTDSEEEHPPARSAFNPFDLLTDNEEVWFACFHSALIVHFLHNNNRYGPCRHQF